MKIASLVLVLIFSRIILSAEFDEELKRGNELLTSLPDFDEKFSKKIFLELCLDGNPFGCEERTLTCEKANGMICLISVSKARSKFPNGVRSVMISEIRTDMHFRPIETKIEGTAFGSDGRQKSKWEKLSIGTEKMTITSFDGEDTETHELRVPEGKFIIASDWLIHLVNRDKFESFAFTEFANVGGTPTVVLFKKVPTADGINWEFAMAGSAASSLYKFGKDGTFAAYVKIRPPKVEARVIDKEAFSKLKEKYEN